MDSLVNRYRSFQRLLSSNEINEFASHTIQRVLEDGSICNTNASKSFFHSLGFIKLVVVAMQDNSQVRFHLWSKMLGVMTPHTHPWDFKSRIVRGSVRDVVFFESKSIGASYIKNACFSSFSKNGHKFESEGELTLGISDDNLYVIGDTYYHRAKDIHLTYASDSAVTLCVTKPPAGRVSYVYSAKDRSVKDNEGLRPLNSAEYKGYLQDILNILKEQNNLFSS